MNRRTLPAELRAGRVATGLVVAAIVFFTTFAAYYLWQQVM
ncbi:hypothetical protein [Paractinoplanes rishiriensis]|uniref:Uncharacterized protein n=1 Tax=Paractinoplanes rishiriensis TaxID=1050105 RepID=A0A919N2P3_9ACTN|nr:hypothetical protein [Actinoplanes rishiriensis]GIF01183.1 hypothetical protein Ari01nite_86470 [Actinoplanes rishiriensis]